MQVKKFSGSDMREALFNIKKEIGLDAVIMQTRTDIHKGIFGLYANKGVEVVVCVDADIVDYAPKAAMIPRGVVTYSMPKFQKTISQPVPKAAATAAPSSAAALSSSAAVPSAAVDLSTLRDDISWIKKALGAISKKTEIPHASGIPEELKETYLYLLEEEVVDDLAREVLKKAYAELTPLEIKSRTHIKEYLRQYISSLGKACEPINDGTGKPVRVAFVGPTGVGKTTTIAKLAAEFSLVKKKKVSVITIDTYRIAAVEQIKTYMDILSIPLEVVTSPDQMRQAIARPAKSDIILIDTAGRSHKNRDHLVELNQFIEAAAPDEVHLVLASTTNYKAATDMIEKFSAIPIKKIIFTKLDEAVNFGLVISVMAKVDKAFSYVTFGQSVPDDIQPADANKLAGMFLEHYPHV
jgi:flagellar biosynthesis protein FlhF